MTINLATTTDDKINSHNTKFIGPAFISLLIRKIVEREDSFEDLPEEVLNDLIRRLNE